MFKGNFSFNLYYYHTSDAIQNLTQVVNDLFTKYSPKNCLTINTLVRMLVIISHLENSICIQVYLCSTLKQNLTLTSWMTKICEV